MKHTQTIFLFVIFCFMLNCNETKLVSRQLDKHISYLASDELSGRFPTTQGDTLARNYIQKYCDKNDVKLFYQPFDYLSKIDIKSTIKVHFQDTVFNLRYGIDYSIRKESANCDLSANLSYLAFGISDSVSGYNDYNNIDLNNKLAIVYNSSPSDTNIYQLEKKNSWRDKIRLAEKYGANGVLFVAPNDKMERIKIIESKKAIRQKTKKFNIPVAVISRKVLNSIMNEANYDLGSVENSLLHSQKSIAFNIPQIKISVDIQNNFQYKNAYNIFSMLSGYDTTQSVVIGAHYDHIPPKKIEGVKDSIRNGADDNASGVAVLLELLNNSQHYNKPVCNIVFVFFSAEESGAIGSKYFIDNKPRIIGTIKAMINLDMVGRMKNDSLYINYGHNLDLWQYIFYQYSQNKFKIIWDEYFGGTDAFYFIENNIPSIWITTGLHPEIHQISDEIDKINIIGMKKVHDLLIELLPNICVEFCQ